MSYELGKHYVIDQDKNRKQSDKHKLDFTQVSCQEKDDLNHADVNMYCDISQFPALKFYGPCDRPHEIKE